MNGYKTTILESSYQLTTKERVRLKDTTNCLKLDEIVPANGDPFVITPKGYVILDVENPNAKENKEYKVYVIVTEDGTKYVTGSESLFTAFFDIFDEMKGEDEPYEIEIYRRPSKNYTGKTFLTCSII